MSELRELAERCEAATGPDRELDALITVALDLRADWLRGHEGEIWFGGEFIGDEPVIRFKSTVIKRRGIGNPPSAFCPAFTASIDAAMTLVPEGWHVGMLTECGEDDFPAACLTENEEPCRDAVGKGVDMTLSLVAAALRAREEDRG